MPVRDTFVATQPLLQIWGLPRRSIQSNARPINTQQPLEGTVIVHELTGETWRFTTRPGPAQQVYLAVDGPTTASRWIEMQPVEGEPDAWSVVTQITPGRHRLRYFTVDNGTYLNCGDVGLTGQRTSALDPDVRIDDMMGLAASA